MTTYDKFPPPGRDDPHIICWRRLKNSSDRAPFGEYITCADSLLAAGSPMLAHDVVRAGLKHYENHQKLRQQDVLALARSQSTIEAYRLARELYDDPATRDIDSVGLLARVLKDMWDQAQTPDLRAECLKRSAELYFDAYEMSIDRAAAGEGPPDFWTGINAATLSVALGDSRAARVLAKMVFKQCRFIEEDRDDETQDRYWLLATLGEAKLIQRDVPKAAKWYERAAQLAYRKRFLGALCSTVRNARILLDALKLSEKDRNRILNCFRQPRVVIFAGHMIDQPDRESPRFPPRIEGPIRQAIEAKLKDYGPVIGFASAACGADVLFLESLLHQCDGQAYVVLPYDRDGFAKDSVRFAGEQWVKRFERVLADATEVITVSPHQRESWGSVTYDYMNMIMSGLAIHAARQLECDLCALTVWNGEPGDGPGGTASIINRWQLYGLDIDVIDPGDCLHDEPVVGGFEQIDRRAGGTQTTAAVKSAVPGSLMAHVDGFVVKALLFADVRKYSKLTEEQMPKFIEHFYGLISRMVRRSSDRPATTEDRGDGVYCVFDSAGSAGRFALDLNECIKNIDWEAELGREIQVRIGLHAGPVHEFVNPMTGLVAYTGTHVSRAARIEPVAPPGEVYASREFAALASLEGLELKKSGGILNFACIYVGQTEWHKDYGLEPTFHVRRVFGRSR